MLTIIRLIFFTVLATALLQACNTTRQVSVLSPDAAPADKAAVYIYRPTAVSNIMYSPDLYIDGEFKISLKSGNNTRILIEAGDHDFELEPDGHYEGETRLKLTAINGQNYFIRVSTSLKLNDTLDYQPYRRSFNLAEISEAAAITQIAECCTGSGRKNIKTDKTVTEKPAKKGFSVDKTQNPFSH